MPGGMAGLGSFHEALSVAGAGDLDEGQPPTPGRHISGLSRGEPSRPAAGMRGPGPQALEGMEGGLRSPERSTAPAGHQRRHEGLQAAPCPPSVPR